MIDQDAPTVKSSKSSTMRSTRASLRRHPDELREELAALGLDSDVVVAEMDAVTERAKIAGAKRGLEQAKRAVLAFKAKPADVSPEDRDASAGNWARCVRATGRRHPT